MRGQFTLSMTKADANYEKCQAAEYIISFVQLFKDWLALFKIWYFRRQR